MAILKGLASRGGELSSKKFWFNIACITATVVLLWVTYRDTIEDYPFIALYCVYLVCIGGFEVIPKMLAMIIEFKNGKGATTKETV